MAVRDGDWKLLVNADGTGAELYDLAADPREARNLAADKPDVRATAQGRGGRLAGRVAVTSAGRVP